MVTLRVYGTCQSIMGGGIGGLVWPYVLQFNLDKERQLNYSSHEAVHLVSTHKCPGMCLEFGGDVFSGG